MVYPDAIDTFRATENLPGLVYNVNDKRTWFAEDAQKLASISLAIEAELGLLPKGSKSSVKQRLDDVDSALSGKQASLEFTPENVANKDTTTTLGSSDTKYPSQKAVKSYVDAAIIAVKSALYPIGTIYKNTSDSRNPATIFGFGTWVSIPGLFLVGLTGAGTFGPIGAVGGEEQHTLSLGEMPTHFHSLGVYNTGFTVAAGGNYGSYLQPTTTDSKGSSLPHNNLPPYRVVYVWQRTA